MAATNSVKITKTILFNEVTRRWSNRYHFTGGTPSDGAHWDTLFTNIVNAEKLALSANCTIVQADGYVAGSEVPVRTKTFTTAGVYAGGSFPQATHVCALGRWSTAARTSKNHPVYLFNYWHDAYVSSNGSGRDVLLPAQKTLWETYMSAWIAGFSDGTISVVRAGPNGAVATGSQCEKYVSHRDLVK
jgi:hypothetical protein